MSVSSSFKEFLQKLSAQNLGTKEYFVTLIVYVKA